MQSSGASADSAEAQVFAGEEPDVIKFEMPSDSIYDQVALWEEYVECGYVEDFNRAIAEDERAKKLSSLQLDYLFSVCDEVCSHAEKSVKKKRRARCALC